MADGISTESQPATSGGLGMLAYAAIIVVILLAAGLAYVSFFGKGVSIFGSGWGGNGGNGIGGSTSTSTSSTYSTSSSSTAGSTSSSTSTSTTVNTTSSSSSSTTSTSTVPGSYITNYLYCVGSNSGATGLRNLSYYAPIYNNGNLGTWNKTTSYPENTTGSSCSIFKSGGNSSIYCTGGQISQSSAYTSNVYYATVSSNGIGKWSQARSYPSSSGFYGAGCSIDGSLLYCIGDGAYQSTTNAINTAQLIMNSGIYGWSSSKSYPVRSFYNDGCSEYGGFMYCIGGTNSGGSPVNTSYFAPVWSNGTLGTWSATTPYPQKYLQYAGCSMSNGYIYCLGNDYSSPYNVTYYATVSSTGIGGWSATTPYPAKYMYGAGCDIYNNYLYCVGSATASGNEVYYAPVSGAGIGQWTQAQSYPAGSFYLDSCAIPGSNSGYYWSSSDTTTTIAKPSVPTPTSTSYSISTGQSATLSDSGAVGGAPPFAYQWYEAYASNALAPISGATSSSYTFSTNSATPIGYYYFSLYANDVLNEMANSPVVQIAVSLSGGGGGGGH